MLKQIITYRKYNTWPSWQLVYEWEEDLAKAFHAPFTYDNKYWNMRGLRRFPLLGIIFTRLRTSFIFCMNADEFLRRSRLCIGNVIPCIIDYYLTEDKLQALYKILSHNKIVLISSREVFDYLKRHDCPLNIVHWPLSLSDRYAIAADTTFEKKHDLVLMGRQNPRLKEYLAKYVESHPDFIYVDRKIENGVFTYFTNKGEVLGSDFDSREKYMELMRSARIGLYATPGTDDKEGRTNGFSQVTPRFLELVASGCHILARYVKNSDTDYYELEKFCPSIETYEQFEMTMDKAKTAEVDMKMYSEYLKKHYTSVRAEQLKEILKTL